MMKCRQCGACCRVAPCAMGKAGPDGICTSLTSDNKCFQYEAIKESEKDSLFPMFRGECDQALRWVFGSESE